MHFSARTSSTSAGRPVCPHERGSESSKPISASSRRLCLLVRSKGVPPLPLSSYCPDPTSFTSVAIGFPFKPIESFPDTLPCCTGVKVTLTVQLAPAASDEPQLFVSV